MEFVKFMSSGPGRSLRVIAGVILFAVGIVQGGAWLALTAVGLVPLFAGAKNVCLAAPLLGQPLKSR